MMPNEKAGEVRPSFEVCYGAGCHELVWEKPGYATFRPCREHQARHLQLPDVGAAEQPGLGSVALAVQSATKGIA
jgi:hypothetical protein